jgi:hypothetical protein
LIKLQLVNLGGRDQMGRGFNPDKKPINHVLLITISVMQMFTMLQLELKLCKYIL